MNPTREQALFALAVGKPAADRAAFLDRECAADLAFRQRLEARLAAHEGQSKILTEGSTTEVISAWIAEVKLTEGQGSVIGRYKLLEKLGEGGFGSVWAAELMRFGIDAMRKIIREREPVRPSTRLTQTGQSARSPIKRQNAKIESDLDWIVMKCLEKDRTRRYETANGLAADLRRYGANEPVMARPPSAVYRFQKAWRRHRVLYSAGIAVAAALVAGVVGTSVGMFQAERERANAEESARRATAASLEAEEAKRLAQANAGELKTNLYFSRIAWAHGEIALRPSNLKKADRLLTDCSEELRNWEWHHLSRRRYEDPGELRVPGGKVVQCVRFSADGRFLATGGGDGAVRIWDAAAIRLLTTLSNHTAYVMSVAFNPTNTALLASLGADNHLRLWNWQSATEVRSWQTNSAKDYGMAYSIAFSPSGGQLAAPGQVREMIIREVASGAVTFILPGHEEAARAVAFDNTGGWIATGSGKGSVNLWDATPTKELELDPSFRTLNYPGLDARDVEIVPGGRTIAIAGSRGVSGKRAPIQLWNIPTFEPTHELPGFLIVTFSLAYDPSGRLLAASGDEPLQPGIAKVKVWNLELRQEAYQVTSFELDERFFSVLFSHDGRWLLGGGNTKKVRIWDAATGREIGVLGEHDKEITKLALSPRGRYLASIGNDDVVKLWDGARLDQPQVPLRQFEGLCEGFTDLIAFGPDERRLAIVVDDASVVIHDLEGTDRAVRLSEQYFRPQAVAFSSDGRRIATGGVDCAIRLWDAVTGRLERTLKSHIDYVTRLRFLQRPEGLWLISCSRDGTVKFWDTANVESGH